MNRILTVDFEKKCGKVRPILGMNGGPRLGGYDLPVDFSREFSELSVPFVRTVTAAGDYGLNQFINIHCIFPDFDADEELPESYNFHPTDLYLSSIKAIGADIFFRLGESPEPYQRKIYAKCPRDKKKWARICEHIIMHYNEGWADGFKMNIKYFEIWSGADRQDCFSDNIEEFFELYTVTALHLRERFPKIKIGGYGMGGFYSQNRLNATEEQKSFVPTMQSFLSYIKEREAPLDFFTWSCHTANPEELAMHVRYSRYYLDSSGFKKTRTMISDYNTIARGERLAYQREGLAAEMASTLVTAHRAQVDMIFYETSDVSSGDNVLFSVSDFRTPVRYAAFQGLKLFAKLYKFKNLVETRGDYQDEIYSLAANNDNEAALILITKNYQDKLEIRFTGAECEYCTITKVVPEGEGGRGSVYRSDNIRIKDNRILLSVKKNEVYCFEIKKNNPVIIDTEQNVE